MRKLAIRWAEGDHDVFAVADDYVLPRFTEDTGRWFHTDGGTLTIDLDRVRYLSGLLQEVRERGSGVSLTAQFDAWCAENGVRLLGHQRSAAAGLLAGFEGHVGAASGKTFLLETLERFFIEAQPKSGRERP